MNKVFILLLCSLFLYTASAQSNQKEFVQSFIKETSATVSYHRATEVPNFIRFSTENALQLSGTTIEEKVINFLTKYAKVFGISDPEKELVFRSLEKDNIGFQHLEFQQEYKGVPIYDGFLKFHFDNRKNLRSINGVFIPEIEVPSIPNITVDEANIIAKNFIQLNAPGANLVIESNRLVYFKKGLVQGQNGLIHLAYEIEVRGEDGHVRDYVFVDALKGDVIEKFDGICHALTRRLYEDNTGNQIWQEGDAFPASLDQWQQNELVGAEHAYHFFNNAFGFTSYDNADAEMRTINNNPGIQCPNATWNGVTANYCTGTASDDVVCHEWGHAYTEYTNNLIYQWQAGALNESYSDIWGETIDLLNNYEDAGEDLSLRTSCNNSLRWKMGEDASAFGGAIRDMWNPNCNGDPGKVTDSQYRCSTADFGGVHSNSGVPNHAYALLVDGGTYNGQTMNALGFTKTAHIFWRAQSVYLTATSDFAVMADALEQSCADLVGIDLEGLTILSSPAGPSGEIITTADCAEVAEAVLAVEFRTEPAQCNFVPILAAAPTLCAGADPAFAIFYDDFESGLGAMGWTVNNIPGNPTTWTPRDWTIENSLPDGRTGSAAFGVDPNIGNCSSDLEQGLLMLESPTITVPANAVGPIQMAFDHYVATEALWDGGNIKYSLNGGAWTLLPGSAFTTNPYNGTLNTTAAGNNNPLQGQDAFNGADGGSLTGSWGQSQIDLSAIGVNANSTIQFRWEMGVDGCTGVDGWYIDDVVVFDCAVPSVSFSSSGAQVNENQADVNNGCLDYYEISFDVVISSAPSQPAAIDLVISGSATLSSNEDYAISPTTFDLDGSNLSQTVTIQIYDDALIENIEDLTIDYTLNANGGDAFADATNQQFSLTIIDDDSAPDALSVTHFQNDFESGLAGFATMSSDSLDWTIDNAAAATSQYWILDANYPGQFIYISDDVCNCDLSSVVLEAPSVDLSNATQATLRFDHAFANQLGETLTVEVSNDAGANWISIYNVVNTSNALGNGVIETPWVFGESVDLSSYAGNNDVRVRFVYNDNSTWAYGAAIDNIALTSNSGFANIQTAINTNNPDEQNLGPNETIHFYDPATENIMMTIENLSGHDYGCVTVEVNQSGTNSNLGWSGNTMNYIASKTFNVIADNDLNTGNYNIYLYYTAAEIAGWEAATGRTMNDLFVFKTEQSILTPMTSDTRYFDLISVDPYNLDHIFKANFNSGLSESGLFVNTIAHFGLSPSIIEFDNPPTDEVVQCDNIPNPIITATSTCSANVSVTYTDNISGGCPYVITRTWEAMDDCGNSTNLTQLITVEDTVAPVFDTVVSDMIVECDAIPPLTMVTATDNCSAATVVFDEVITGSCLYTIQRTWTAFDDCGNTVTQSQIVTVEDTTPPTFDNVPLNETVECDVIPAVPMVTATDNCSTATVTFAEVTTGSCPFTVVRTWTATDDCGNTASNIQVITVVDSTPPTFDILPTDIFVTCEAIPTPPAVTATDNCSTAVNVFYVETIGAGCPFTITREWFAEDECANIATHIQTIAVEDIEPPIFISSPADVTVECDAIPTPPTLTAIDNCSFAVGIDFIETYGTGCPSNIVRMWIATDECGNTTEHTQVVTVDDIVAPTFDLLPVDGIFECIDKIPPVSPVTATDNCSPDVTVTFSEQIFGACPMVVERVWIATDDCGNAIDHIQTIFIEDFEPPSFDMLPSDETVSCDAIPFAPTLTAFDNCANLVDVLFNETITNGCPYQIIRMWTAEDGCANIVDHFQTITVEDTTPPTLSMQPVDITVDCNAIPAIPTISATDNCSLVPVSFVETIGTGCPYSIVRSWEAVDDCNNSVQYTQTIIVEDVNPPIFDFVPTDLFVQCDAIPSPVMLTASDDCDTFVDVVYTEIVGIGCSYEIVREWVSIDDCGNTTSATQLLFVEDTTPPIFINLPADQTVACDAIPAAPVVNAIDNCSSFVNVFYNEILGGGCPATIEREWTAEDECGNMTFEIQIITIEDSTPPVFVSLPPDLTLECDGTIPNPATVIATDNCSNFVNVFFNETVGTGCPFTITREWTAEDECFNLATYIQTITIEDTTAPIFVGVPADVTIECGDPLPTMVDLNWSDACDGSGTVSGSDSSLGGTCPEYMIRSWTYTDACGNTVNASQFIVIMDTVSPVISAPADLTVNCPFDVPALADASWNDGCDGMGLVTGTESSNNALPEIITRFWTYTDACGNTGTGIQNITVIFDSLDTDNDGICDGADTDDDNDGIFDIYDNDPLNPFSCQDLDNDGCDDCSIGTDGFGPLADNDPFNDGTDSDGDGICDPACLANLVISSIHTTNTDLFEVYNNITSTETVTGSSNIDYSAGVDIDLLPGFCVTVGAEFHGYILGCNPPLLPAPTPNNNFPIDINKKEKYAEIEIQDLVDHDEIEILLFDSNGLFLWEINDFEIHASLRKFRFDFENLRAGSYFIEIRTNDNLLNKVDLHIN